MNGNLWQQEELKVLREFYPRYSIPISDLKKLIPSHPASSIQKKAAELGIRRVRHGRKPVHPVIKVLRQRRNKLGLDRYQLAAILGYESTSIRNWELGVNNPTFFSLLNWCEGLGVDLCIREKSNG